MSQLNVNIIKNEAGTAGPTLFGDVTITGSINTSGIITATSFSGSGANLTGVGLGTTGSINTSGIITATSFSGNGSGLTGVGGTSVFAAGTAAAPSISPTGDSNTGIFFPAADTVAISEGGAEALRVDSFGRLLVGTTTAPTTPTGSSAAVFAGFNNGGTRGTTFTYNEPSSSAGPRIALTKSRANNTTGFDVVSSGDEIGMVSFQGADGSGLIEGARITAFVDGTPGANDMPGRLVFSTTADGAASPTERMRITSDGKVKINGGVYSVLWFDSSYNNYKSAIVSEDITNYGRKHMYFVSRTSEDSSSLVLANDTYLFAGANNELCFPKIDTTASAANAFLSNVSGFANRLLRSTSSLRYKTDIEDLEEKRSSAILDFRPVWYRSISKVDCADWSWYGLIAEEVAQIEPRLVHWIYLDDSYEEVDGKKQLKLDAEMVPDGIQYDRLTVLLLDVVKRQQKAIETLEQRLTDAGIA